MNTGPDTFALKANRAAAQAISLEHKIRPWSEVQSASIYRELENGGRDHVYRVGDPRPVDPLWLVVFGEILYDLRSALDHIAHALVAPPGHGSEFPIFYEEHGRDGFIAKAPGKLPGLWQDKPAAWDIIKKLQPYQAASAGRDPKLDPLWILHELNIIDKHRYPLVTLSDVEQTTWVPAAGVRRQPEYIPGSGRDFVQDNRVATFRFPDPHPEINLNAQFTLDVFFDEVAPRDRPATQTLGDLASYVRGKVFVSLLD